MNVTVTVDSRDVERMLERLAGAPNLLSGVVQDVAHQAAGMVTGVPRDTGELAGSVTATRGRNPAPGSNSMLIVSDLPYARFVWGGTRYMPAQRPTFDAGATARILAENVARELLG